MDPTSILEQWLAPITGPLKDFRTQITDLADTHQSTLTSFNNLVNDLTNPGTQDAFTGPGADAMQTSANTFFGIEQPMSDLLMETAPVEAITASDLAVDGIMAAIFTAGGEVADTGPLVAVTEGVDAAALLQGGLDPLNDGAAIGITTIEAVALTTILLQLAGTIFLLWLTWSGALDNLVASMNPALPEQPKGVTLRGPLASTASTLAKRYGVPEADVEEIISNNPGLTEEEYALLVQHYKKYGAMPFNVRTVFTGVNQKGQTQIYYITSGDMKHILSHEDDHNLRLLSNAELLLLIQKLLQKKPDEKVSDSRKQFIDHYYNLANRDGDQYTVIIRISTSNQGRIISAYEEW